MPRFNFPYLYTLAKMKERENRKPMSSNKLLFQPINPGNPPKGTVLAANVKTTENGWEFTDDPVVGSIQVRNGKCYCVVPFFDPDDQSPYRELVTHFLSYYDLEKHIDVVNS